MKVNRRKAMKIMALGTVATCLAPTMGMAFGRNERSLFEPVRIGGLKIKNRLFKAATSMELGDEHGRPTPEHLKVYEEAAKGGPGLIVTDVTFASFDDRPGHADLSIHSDEQIPSFKALADTIRSNGAKACLQIGWAGSMTASRYRLDEREIWGPSAVEHPMTKVTPKAISKSEIKYVVKALADAARRGKQAGFDAVELHLAHNFMLNQFLVPYYNKRTDEYGGGIENRTRLAFEIMEAIRAEVGPDYPVFAKIHGQDYLEKVGMTLEEGVFLAKGLVKRGVTALELSGGNLMNGPETMPWRPDLEGDLEAQTYFAKDAEVIGEALNVPLIVTGGNRNVKVMERVLNTTPDVVAFGMSRTLLSEPDLPGRWMKDTSIFPECISCNECMVNYGHGPTVCALNE